MKEYSYEDSAYKDLIDGAIKAIDMAYAPYSHYKVGAGLLDSAGRIWRGCNIENTAYGACNCAERTALFKALSEGVRKFKALAIVARHEGAGELADDFAAPCGICRQVLNEFCQGDFLIILARRDGLIREYRLDELLPEAFGPKNLK